MHAVPAWLTVSVCDAMVAVSVREDDDVLGGIVIVTVPLPEPVAGVAPRPDAFHAQVELDAPTAIDALPPAEVASIVVGLIANEHVDPNCVIAKGCPLTLIDPLRVVETRFTAIVYVTVADPVPLDGDVMVIHVSDATAVQAQSELVPMPKLADPPLFVTLAPDGVRVKLHGAAGCTVSVTGTESSTFAAPDAFAPMMPTYVPGASEATSRLSDMPPGVVPAPADSVAPGMPMTAAVNGTAALVVVIDSGTDAGAGDPIT